MTSLERPLESKPDSHPNRSNALASFAFVTGATIAGMFASEYSNATPENDAATQVPVTTNTLPKPIINAEMLNADTSLFAVRIAVLIGKERHIIEGERTPEGTVRLIVDNKRYKVGNAILGISPDIPVDVVKMDAHGLLRLESKTYGVVQIRRNTVASVMQTLAASDNLSDDISIDVEFTAADDTMLKGLQDQGYLPIAQTHKILFVRDDVIEVATR
jgi:hypothetical protein